MQKNFKLAQAYNSCSETDGLWDDDKTDEEQIGRTYDELEWAMNLKNQNKLSEKQKKILDIYNYLLIKIS